MRSSRSFASMVIIDGGPGVTDNINPPNVVSVGNPSGVLTLTLPSLVDRFGFGFAVSNANPVPNATAVSRFNGPRRSVRSPATASPILFSPEALPGKPHPRSSRPRRRQRRATRGPAPHPTSATGST